MAVIFSREWWRLVARQWPNGVLYGLLTWIIFMLIWIVAGIAGLMPATPSYNREHLLVLEKKVDECMRQLASVEHDAAYNKRILNERTPVFEEWHKSMQTHDAQQKEHERRTDPPATSTTTKTEP